MRHPLSECWEALLADCEEKIPDIVTLPKAEITRLIKMAFFYGINIMAMGMAQIENLIANHSKDVPDPPSPERLRTIYALHTLQYIRDNNCGSFEQIFATMRAHEPTEQAMPEIVKVQVPLAWSPGVNPEMLAYAKGGTKKCLLTPTPEVIEQIGDRPKAYFNGIWTGKTWVLKDVVADQPW